MVRVPHPGAPVTAERIERALDGLAGIIVAACEAGRVYLPIFQRLERELAAIREAEEAMDAVFVRARRRER